MRHTPYNEATSPAGWRAPDPVTIAAVHLLANNRRTLCGLAKSKVDQWCPVGMWPAVKADHKCPLCDSAYGKLACTEA